MNNAQNQGFFNYNEAKTWRRFDRSFFLKALTNWRGAHIIFGQNLNVNIKMFSLAQNTFLRTLSKFLLLMVIDKRSIENLNNANQSRNKRCSKIPWKDFTSTHSLPVQTQLSKISITRKLSPIQNCCPGSHWKPFLGLQKVKFIKAKSYKCWKVEFGVNFIKSFFFDLEIQFFI